MYKRKKKYYFINSIFHDFEDFEDPALMLVDHKLVIFVGGWNPYAL